MGGDQRRLAFVQPDRWLRIIDGGTGVYDETRCCYCARPVRPDATRVRTARTNDGEWWLVAANEDLSSGEWRDFQTQADGSRAATLLPIGPDCLADHPEFAFAIVAPIAQPAGKNPTSKEWERAEKRARRKPPACSYCGDPTHRLPDCPKLHGDKP